MAVLAALHLHYLIGFQNRLLVLTRWGFAYVAGRRGAWLITGAEPTALPVLVRAPRATSCAVAH
jgi:hypothetical protein